MAYRVFISHSTSDLGLVTSLANLLSKFGMKVVVAEWYLRPGVSLDEKVLESIRSSDCLVALLTRSGTRSAWVHHEIGCARGLNVPVIPLVEKGVDAKGLAGLEGKEYVEYDPRVPREALTRVSAYVKSLELKKEDKERNLRVAGAILAFLLLLSGDE